MPTNVQQQHQEELKNNRDKLLARKSREFRSMKPHTVFFITLSEISLGTGGVIRHTATNPIAKIDIVAIRLDVFCDPIPTTFEYLACFAESKRILVAKCIQTSIPALIFW